MTREEAISVLERVAHTESKWPGTEDTLEALDMAISALRQQEQEGNDWICTLKCTALMDEGMCSHGGLCCLHESHRIIQEKEPLTLDELLEMHGQPVWIVEYPDWGHWELFVDAEDYVVDRDPVFYGMKHDDPDGRYGLHKLGWLAFRQKPEE